jgi:penicillin-binding protein 1A
MVHWALRRLLLLGLILAASLVAAVWLGAFGPMPSVEGLGSLAHPNASRVLSADGRFIGQYSVEDRHLVPVDALPRHVLDALVATEDVRFYTHGSIDWRSMPRVMGGLALGKDWGGGSTLAQQWAKNLFGRPSAAWALPAVKLREMILGHRLLKAHGHDGVLVGYLNTVPFGENCFGIETASWRFFNKPAEALRLEEAAVLVGLLKANTYYSPRLHPDRSRERRNVVLQQMGRYGYLDPDAVDSLQALPLELDYTRRGAHEGLAPYFRARVRREAEALLQELHKANGAPYDLERDGLRVYTTLDQRLQEAAEAALSGHMADLQVRFARDPGSRLSAEQVAELAKATDRFRQALASGATETEAWAMLEAERAQDWFGWQGEQSTTASALDSIQHHREMLQAAMLVADPGSGRVLAWIGGAEHRRFPYDRVEAGRPAGSTVKPLFYAAALEAGADPQAWWSAEQPHFPEHDNWMPRNADGRYDGYWSMAGALAHSVNTASVRIYQSQDGDVLRGTLRNMGLEADWGPYPAQALGSGNARLTELVEAYGVFAEGGQYRPLYTVERIESASGEVLVERPPAPPKRVLREDVALRMRGMLELAVDSGTAASLRRVYGLSGGLAGKTGTTQDQADGWYLGFGPGMVAGVWVGADDPSLHFSSLANGQGAAMALPIWARFWRQARQHPRYGAALRKPFDPLPDSLARSLEGPLWAAEHPDERGWDPFEPGFWERLFGPRKRRMPRREEDTPNGGGKELHEEDGIKGRKRPRRERREGGRFWDRFKDSGRSSPAV